MKALMIIAPSRFRDEELFETKEVLENGGVEITIASKGVKKSTGMLGRIATVNKDISEVNVKDYNAVIFIGGQGASVYFNDKTVLGIAKKAYGSGKIVAAICIAPVILANAGLLKGKRATSFSSEKNTLVSKGALVSVNGVESDGKLITAEGPSHATEFGEMILKALKS